MSTGLKRVVSCAVSRLLYSIVARLRPIGMQTWLSRLRRNNERHVVRYEVGSDNPPDLVRRDRGISRIVDRQR